MRVIKLSKDEFPDEAALNAYFSETLKARNPQGLFLMNPRIARDGLIPGERLVFVYGGKVRYLASAETGRQDNSYLDQGKYPCCFVIDVPSIQKVDTPIAELELQLARVGVMVSLGGRAWNRIDDSDAVESAILELASSAQPA